MTRLQIAVVALGVLSAGILLGRLTAPVQVEIQEREVVKRQVITVTAVRTHQAVATRTVEREVRVPGGTVTIERVIEAKAETHVEENSRGEEKTDARREVAVSPVLPQWRVSGLVGTGLPLVPIYGAHVERRILGPVSVGAWALSSGVGGLSVGVSF